MSWTDSDRRADPEGPHLALEPSWLFHPPAILRSHGRPTSFLEGGCLKSSLHGCFLVPQKTTMFRLLTMLWFF